MTKETREPDIPVNWPHGHVAVEPEPRGSDSKERLRLGDVDVALTDDDDDECVMITLGEYHHYLHSSTSRELSNMLIARPDGAIAVTIHGVTHTVNTAAARAFDQLLQRRLVEWNRRPAKFGMPGV